jgi:hypothetical protein
MGPFKNNNMRKKLAQWYVRLVQFDCTLIAIYHIFIGFFATIIPEGAAQVAPVVYRVSLEVFAPMKPEYLVMIRFMGAFAFTFGILMAFAAWNPFRNSNIILGGTIFFLVRIIDRILGADILITSFHTTSVENLRHILLMASFVIVLGGFTIFKLKFTTKNCCGLN